MEGKRATETETCGFISRSDAAAASAAGDAGLIFEAPSASDSPPSDAAPSLAAARAAATRKLPDAAASPAVVVLVLVSSPPPPSPPPVALFASTTKESSIKVTPPIPASTRFFETSAARQRDPRMTTLEAERLFSFFFVSSFFRGGRGRKKGREKREERVRKDCGCPLTAFAPRPPKRAAACHRGRPRRP